jgi:hypothetical protein
MNRKFLAFGLLLSCIATIGVAQEKQQTSTPPIPQIPAKQSTSSTETAITSKGELIALQNDVRRMRVLLHQMQNNMGAATNAQDPLKHQFELEIEMWQVLLDQMDRRIKAAGGQ